MGDDNERSAADAGFGDIRGEVEEFAKKQRTRIDENNQEEFIEVGESGRDSARTSTKYLDKEEHMRASVVDNQDGPLSRSVIATTSGKLVSPHGMSVAFDANERPHFNGLEERVRNIETHMGIIVAPLDKNLVERVKILEDKILRIEQFYPQIAAHVFNYGKAEVEASARPGGRVSKFPGQAGAKKRNREDFTMPKGDESVNVGEENSSLDELRRRMDELKSRLLKQANSK